MNESREQRLWQACTEGDFEVAKELADDPAVEVSWGDPEVGRTPFYRACFFGRTSVVEYLMRNPRVDVVRQQSQGATPFLAACQEGHKEVVSLLLADTRIDPNEGDDEGYTPFFIACEKGHKEVVSLLLADPRIDPNKRDNDQSTPLWVASQNGHLVVVQHLLASAREIDTRKRSTYNNMTAAENGRALGGRSTKPADETEEVFQRRKTYGPHCADLIDAYEKDPPKVRSQLRKQLGLPGNHPLPSPHSPPHLSSSLSVLFFPIYADPASSPAKTASSTPTPSTSKSPAPAMATSSSKPPAIPQPTLAPAATPSMPGESPSHFLPTFPHPSP